jgi:hypothetical protein
VELLGVEGLGIEKKIQLCVEMLGDASALCSRVDGHF